MQIEDHKQMILGEIVNRYILDPYSNKVYPYDTKTERYGYNDFELTQNLLEWISDTCNVVVTEALCL